MNNERSLSNPLTILMVVDSLGIGGTETHVLTLAKSLKAKGHRIIVGTGGGPLSRRYEEAGIELITMPFQNDNPLHTNYTTLLEQTRNIVQEYNVDLIHAHQIAGLKIANQISQEQLIPVILTVHGMFYPRRQLQALIDGCAHVIAVSPPAANWLSRSIGYPSKQISIIPNGIDISHYKPLVNQQSEFRKELGLSESMPLIALVGRMAWGKTRVIEDAIYALEDINKTDKVRLALVGSGPDSPFIHALATMVNQRHNNDIIQLTGAMLDPLDAYHGSDIVIGTARVALEAMSCGKPVIAVGNSGYVGPITPTNFLEGWQYYFGDHDFIVQSSKMRLKEDIVELLQTRKNLDTRRVRKLVADHFRIEKVVTNLEQLYYQILEGQGEIIKLPSLIPTEPKSMTIRTLPKSAPQTISQPNDPKATPLVSVVIPSYNQDSYLEQCLNGLIKQTYRPLEIILVDDHSSDNTIQIGEKWQAELKDNPSISFRYHRLPRNLGFAPALSVGYMLAQGDLVANHDSDDVSHPDRIAQQVEFLQLNEDYSMVGTNYEVFSEDIEERKKSYLLRYDNNIINCYREGKHCVCFGSLLFRKNVIDRIGGLTTFMLGAEDYEYVARAIVQGFNVQNLRTSLYYYREHSKQRSKDFYGTRAALTSHADSNEGETQ